MSKKTLTTPFNSDDYAELSAAVEILGHRSLNAFVHQLVMQKIREAKQLVSPEEFAKIVEANKEEIGRRSKQKSKERLEMLGELAPNSAKKMPIIEAETKPKKKVA